LEQQQAFEHNVYIEDLPFPHVNALWSWLFQLCCIDTALQSGKQMSKAELMAKLRELELLCDLVAQMPDDSEGEDE